MKSTVLLALIWGLFAFSPDLTAQSSGGSGVEITKGVRAGWHYAGMFRNGNQKFDNLNSFYVGFFSEGKSTGFLGAGSGLEYFQNGFEKDGQTFRMHTLSIPFYVKPTIGPIYGTAGVSLNFKLTDNREDFPTQVVDTKIFDLPLTLGLGVQLGPIIGEARYFWGLFDAATVDGSGHKNQYLQVGLGLKF